MTKSIGNFKEKQNKFLKSVTARLTVQQVVDNVRSNGSLTFDFICYIIFASWIAAMGLLDNSVISLVASMLVSPMMVSPCVVAHLHSMPIYCIPAGTTDGHYLRNSHQGLLANAIGLQKHPDLLFSGDWLR